MTALRNGCSATDTLLDIDTALGIDAYPKPYTIGSEVVNVVGGGHALSITVERGIGGTTAATHVNGTALTAANAFSGGGGGVTVDNTVDPPFSASTLIAAGATESAPDEATFPSSVQNVLSVAVPLTDAQIKALPTTPIELVAAPGADKTVMLLGAFLRIDTSNNGYENIGDVATLLLTFTGEGSGPAQGVLGNQNPPGGPNPVTDLLSSFTNLTVLLAPYTTVIPILNYNLSPALVDIGDMSNKALILSVTNEDAAAPGTPLGDFTEGDPLNSGTVKVIYTVVDL